MSYVYFIRGESPGRGVLQRTLVPGRTDPQLLLDVERSAQMQSATREFCM
jgi:hypothetical protein